jgi:LuxR family maltose regulon positive regulatory protein
LRRTCPVVGIEIELPVEDIVASLVNDLDALAGSTVVALDDYHVIDTSEVHDAVALLLDHLPPHLLKSLARDK